MNKPCRNHPGGILDAPPERLGGGIILDKPNQEEQFLQLEATNEEPELVTVCFDVNTVPPTNDATDHRLYANLLWASHSGKNQAVIDLTKGTRISLEASNLRATATLIGTVVPKIAVFASVGYGSVGKAPPLTFTGASETLLAGALGAIVRIPKYAYSVSILSNHDPLVVLPAPRVATFFQGPAATAPIYYRADAQGGAVAILNGAEFMRIQNGAVAQKVTPIFQLTL